MKYADLIHARILKIRYQRVYDDAMEKYTRDKSGHEHKGKGPGGGQFTSGGGGGGSAKGEKAKEPAEEHADAWEDVGEGPWDTEEAAQDFLDAEVGDSSARLKKKGNKWGIEVNRKTGALRGTEHETMPDKIREWVKKQFAAHRVDSVTEDLIDVATGNREGNYFEKAALMKIFPDSTPGGEKKN